MHKKEEAVECFNKVIEIDPNDAEVLDEKGTALNTLGRNAEALECFEKAI